jgi:streptomycin 6-kinase
MNEYLIKKLPKQFTRNALDLCGAAGEKWLGELPRIIQELSKSWSLEVEPFYEILSYNFVAPCVAKDGEAVLKIAPPLNNPEIFNEARYLQLADGKGAVNLLRINETHRAILLERLTPGANLKEVYRTDDAKAVDIAIKTIGEILKKPPQHHSFHKLEDWFDDFFRNSEKTRFPSGFICKARGFYEELSSASENKFLLHGDLHHENVLSATRESFLAIDPKGIVGDIGYEIAVFLNNHFWWLASERNLRDKLSDAIRKFSEAFAVESVVLRKWAFAQMVLSVWWTFEGNGRNWKSNLALSEIWDV